MRQNDLLKSEHMVTICGFCFTATSNLMLSTVNAAKCHFPISTPSLLQMERLPPDMYRLFALDEDISDRQRQQRDRRAALIAPLLVEECIYDKSLPQQAYCAR